MPINMDNRKEGSFSSMQFQSHLKKCQLLAILCFFVRSVHSQNSSQARGPASAIPFPTYRYIVWNQLSDTAFKASINLAYTGFTWNTPGSAKLEQLAWVTLGEQNQGFAKTIGFNQEVWDCYSNHYDGYTWSELQAISVDQYWAALGWDQSNWESNSSAVQPASVNASWADLTSAEQKAASELCYIQETWDGVELVYWVTSPAGQPAKIEYPTYRYTLWKDLKPYQQRAAMSLNYTSTSWNLPGTATVERFSWYNLGKARQVDAINIGFDDAAIWDCYINHFQDFTWNRLVQIHRDKFWSVLGYNQTTWQETQHSFTPSALNKKWAQLTTEEQAAATELCYFQQTWDEVGLENFAISPTTQSKSSTESYFSRSTVGLVSFMTYLFMI